MMLLCANDNVIVPTPATTDSCDVWPPLLNDYTGSAEASGDQTTLGTYTTVLWSDDGHGPVTPRLVLMTGYCD